MRKSFLTAAVIAALTACSGPVALDRLAEKVEKACPGDTITVKAGSYSDISLKLCGKGTAEKPVVVIAEEPGAVIISGKSELRISGEGLEINGFMFRKATTGSESIVEFREGNNYANNCRLTECVFDNCNPARRDSRYSMVHLYGRHNRVDHNSFMGRLNLGVTLVVRLTDKGCDENYHEIDHNYFGPRPVYGSNGAESIQIGLAGQCMQSCRTHLHDNMYDRCNGEVECISIKSSDNVIEDNVLYECQGVLALRHGDRNLARGNIFIGNGVVNTGGIRVVGEDQVIENNRFYGLKGHRFFAPLALMCGVPNSLPNRYMQVKRTVISGNVWSDCEPLEFNTGLDRERTLEPVDTKFENNTITTGLVPPSYESLLEGKGAEWYVPETRDETPDVIELKDSTYVLESSMEIRKPTVIRAIEGAHPVIRYAGKDGGSMITICDGGSLTVNGVHFDGTKTPGKAAASKGICTAKDMIKPYTLVIEDCRFSKIGTIGNGPIFGTKGTMADSVVIRRTSFEACAGNAISYAGESEDIGRYNCEYLLLEDCRFSQIAEVSVNIYRGGCDESTAGPRMVVRNCEFNDCSNKVRSAAIRAIGVQDLLVTGCNFIHSGRGSYSIKLDDAPWEKIVINSNSFEDSGRILANRTI